MTIVENPDAVVGGVDTHADVHVAAAINHVGGVLGVESFPTTSNGYRRLVSWFRSYGELALVGVEGTGSYGVGLSRYLQGCRCRCGRGGSTQPSDSTSTR